MIAPRCIAKRYTERMAQLVTRIPEHLADEVDRLVRDGFVRSRSDAVRLGLQAIVDAHRRAAVGRSIVAGYERTPPDDDRDEWAEAAGRALIEAEPW